MIFYLIFNWISVVGLFNIKVEDGLKNVSATMSAGGNTMEQTIGMLTAMVEITRSANKSSRGLRQIVSRLTQTLDEDSKTGGNLTKIYEGLGIAIKGSDGQIRSTYDILKDLSKQWNSLSKNEQEYIALTSAGSNQVLRNYGVEYVAIYI